MHSLQRQCGRLLCGIALYLGFGTPAWADGTLWQALHSGEAVGLLRHSLAPGGGDPAHFNVADCATQRNPIRLTVPPHKSRQSLHTLPRP